MRALIRMALLASLSVGMSAPARALTASVEANGFAFSFGAAATNAGFTLFFTTYDGSSGSPLEDCSGDFCTVSQEVAPATIGSATYRSDYFAQDNSGTFEYGSGFMTLVASDGDADGILDPLERTRPGNFSFSGSTTPDFNAFGIYVTSSVSGSVQRSANSLVGTYSGSFSNTTQSASFAGAYSLSGASGTVEYQLGGGFLDWHLVQRGLDGTLRTFTGTSPFSRDGIDSIATPSFALYDSASSLALFVNGATLQRSGNIFRGTVTLADGGVDTSWADYTTYRVEITDPNDTDADGLPDLVSVPEPDVVSSSLLALFLLSLIFRGGRPTRQWSWRPLRWRPAIG